MWELMDDRMNEWMNEWTIKILDALKIGGLFL